MEYSRKGCVLKRLLLWGIALAVLAALAVKFFPTNERMIRNRLASLADTVSIRPGESQLARLAKASQVVEFFTPDATLEVKDVNISLTSREDLREAMLAARANLREADIGFEGVHLKFPEEKSLATAYVMAVARLNQDTNALVQELKMTLRKIEGRWLISRVESVGL